MRRGDGRRVDHQDGIDLGRMDRGSDGEPEVVVGRTPVERKGSRDHRQAGGLQRCCGKNTRAARVREHRDPRPQWNGLRGQHPRGVQHGSYGGHLDQPGLLIQRSPRRADRRGAGADSHDGSFATHATGDAGELARVAEGLGVHGDDPGVLVVLPELQQVVARDVGLVAQRHEPRQSDRHLRGKLQHRCAQRTRLQRDSDAARWKIDWHERSVHLGGPGNLTGGDAHAGRPDQPQAVAAGVGNQRSDVHIGAVDGRHDHCAPHPFGDALLDHVGQGVRRGSDDSQPHVVLDVQHRCVRGAPADGVVVRVHSEHRQRARRDAMPQFVADRPQHVGRADHCDRPG